MEETGYMLFRLHNLNSPCPNQRSFLSHKMRSRSSSSSFASNSLDLTVAISSGLILQFCLILAQSLRCKRCRFVLVSGQVSLAWSMALRTQELYTWPPVLLERWRDVKTGSSSLDFIQAVFTRVVTVISQPPSAESMSPRQQEETITPSLSGLTWTSLCGLQSIGQAFPMHTYNQDWVSVVVAL